LLVAGFCFVILACFAFDNMGEAADVGAGLVEGPQRQGIHPSLERGYPNLFATEDPSPTAR